MDNSNHSKKYYSDIKYFKEHDYPLGEKSMYVKLVLLSGSLFTHKKDADCCDSQVIILQKGENEQDIVTDNNVQSAVRSLASRFFQAKLSF